MGLTSLILSHPMTSTAPRTILISDPAESRRLSWLVWLVISLPTYGHPSQYWQGNRRHQTSLPGAAAWRTRWNIMICLVLPHWRHSVKKRCHRPKNEPRPQLTRTENFVKFVMRFLRYGSGLTDIQTDNQTDRQTYTHVHRNTSHAYGGDVWCTERHYQLVKPPPRPHWDLWIW